MISRPSPGVKSRIIWQNDAVVVHTTSEALGRIPLLASLPEVVRGRLAELCGVRRVVKGEILFSEGEEASFLPLLLSGEVKLYRVAPAGREQVLHLVRAPASFAEAAVFGPGIFPATAEVLKNGELVLLSREALVDLLRRSPEVALALLASMSVWLRRLADLVEGLSLHTVEERVAAYLLAVFRRSRKLLLAGTEVHLDEPKHLIAALCGTAPEVLSRTFRKLEEEGVVRVDGPVATLLDAARLASLAGDGEPEVGL